MKPGEELPTVGRERQAGQVRQTQKIVDAWRHVRRGARDVGIEGFLDVQMSEEERVSRMLTLQQRHGRGEILRAPGTPVGCLFLNVHERNPARG